MPKSATEDKHRALDDRSKEVPILSYDDLVISDNGLRLLCLGNVWNGPVVVQLQQEAISS